MNKRLLPGRLLAVWAAISAVLIIAGIVLFSLFGFNVVSPEKKTVEVSYDAIIYIEEKETVLADECESAFDSLGLKPVSSRTDRELDVENVSDTGSYRLVYTFNASVPAANLNNAAELLRSKIAANSELGGEVTVSAHTMAGERFYEASWRAAVALAVAAIVALVYIGFRFGWASAIAGLVACLNDTLLTLSVFALARIPVYAYAPALFAGIAAVLSVIVWVAQCMKMRENFKDPSYSALSAQEAVGLSVVSSWKSVLAFVIPVAVVFAVLGGVATGGLRLFMLPALIPVAVSVYSSYLLAPAVLVPLKGKFDAIKLKSKRYTGKKKAEAQE